MEPPGNVFQITASTDPDPETMRIDGLRGFCFLVFSTYLVAGIGAAFIALEMLRFSPRPAWIAFGSLLIYLFPLATHHRAFRRKKRWFVFHALLVAGLLFLAYRLRCLVLGL